MIGRVKIKTTASTSNVIFTNTERGFYDMIISIQNSLVNQTINIYDTEGNLVTEDPIPLNQSAKIIIKDVKIGKISFSDPNSYLIVISYTVKVTASGIPYIDIDYASANTVLSSAVEQQNIWQPLDNVSSIPVPSGKKWIIKSVQVYWTASETATQYVQFGLIPNGELVIPGSYTLIQQSISATSGDTYSAIWSVYAETSNFAMEQNSANNIYTFAMPKELEAYNSGYSLIAYSSEPTNTIFREVEYVEVNIQ